MSEWSREEIERVMCMEVRKQIFDRVPFAPVPSSNVGRPHHKTGPVRMSLTRSFPRRTTPPLSPRRK